ncbi:hypothetical protein [Alteromonas sp. KUL49]|uniref:hypothetical protein n=1 Tax=Alteromonas sp. KUL49 TaxID=2480798 RepID=UPI00102EED1C|nr:hypothetical protein [Alteromonas sp. KUL49]TAP37878.1 hypothetical protein EYS00_15375 [Alteromonas sp. KUL49]GEA12737.1 hypothetical protein KUL49_31120 [Alteromonas sp. KUL49]
MNNIFIHIGPPKSGTSAIQKWLSENRQFLVENNIYYPEHTTDENGVSSGNLLTIFSRSEDDFVVDKKKCKSLLEEFSRSGATRLLLSSEFFFKRAEQLSDVFPEATFIGYLRFPLEVAESSYNQGVKRHAQIHAFGLPNTPRAYQLEILDSLIKKVGREHFILRPYHEECFEGGNLVADFLTNFDIVVNDIEPRKINPSYTLEGLEFKRWFNQLNLDSVQSDMDRFLQSEQSGTTNYSLIPPSVFKIFKSAFVEQMTLFCNSHQVTNREHFLQLCNELIQKPKVHQSISNDEFQAMLEKFLELPGIQKKMLTAYEREWKYQSIERYPERLDIVANALPLSKKLVHRLRDILNKA